MEKIDLQNLLASKLLSFRNKNSLVNISALKVLERILNLNEINSFIEKHGHLSGIDFIEEVFDYLNFSFRISNKDLKKIPAEGRLVIVANHPIGSLDGLALLNAVYNVRKDVKIVANNMLSVIANIDDMLLPFDLFSKKAQKRNIEAIGEALQKEETVIIFPAGEVSRARFYRIMDSEWNKGAVHFAKKFNAPILPVFVKAKNSFLFYLLSTIYKPLSTLLLPREMFNKTNKTINIRIFNPIPDKVFSTGYIDAKTQAKLLRKHLYKLSKNSKGIFKTEKTIIHPVDIKLLVKEIRKSKLLGEAGGKKIVLTNFFASPNIMQEIARLREVTFRSVGEGSGMKKDLDKYDRYYEHIVLWDEEELDIVGSYRIGRGDAILDKFGHKGFYTSSLFKFSSAFVKEYLSESIELGRSFVQKKYWNTNSLNYLWQGIGAYLADNPDIKYMFGPVSISNNYPEEAKRMIVYFYNKWFGSINNLAESKNRFILSELKKNEFVDLFDGENYKNDYLNLKRYLKEFGFTVPILYKHYSELCQPNGVRFLDFGVDSDFENCIDGLILVSVDLLKEEKRKRYVDIFKHEVEMSNQDAQYDDSREIKRNLHELV